MCIRDRIYTDYELSLIITDTAEYRTIINCTPVLVTAVQSNLAELSSYLLRQHLITSDNDRELRNGMYLKRERAARLVELMQDKVKLNPDNYYTFIKILEKDRRYYRDILEVMKKTHDALTEGGL